MFALVLALGSAACGSDASRDPASPFNPRTATRDRAPDATNTLSIHGTVETSEIDTYQPETNSLVVQLTGTGVASHLGRFTLVDDGVASLTTGVGSGSVTYTAADGATLTGSASGGAVIVGDIAEITDAITITGGTGRFEGATGSLAAIRRLDLGTLRSSGSFEGVINLAK
jgi:hypothetical protein